MSATEPTTTTAADLAPRRPKRADARRNYDAIVATAHAAFADTGAATPLEEIARRAGVGIGTLYRNFPNRQALLEAVYIDEVEQLCESADELAGLDPWEAAVAWLRRCDAYLATKHALAAELFEHVDRDAPVFTRARTAMYAAGEPLLERAQAAGEMREDVTLADVMSMLFGIVKTGAEDPERMMRLAGIVLDGLRVPAA